MITVLRWIAAIAVMAVGIVLQALAYNVPMSGALGVIWRSLTFAVILGALVYIIAYKLFRRKPPPESDGPG